VFDVRRRQTLHDLPLLLDLKKKKTSESAEKHNAEPSSSSYDRRGAHHGHDMVLATNWQN
jgi:hypothetical protein